MKPYIITVEFRLRPGCVASFLPLIQENARSSLANEPGCRRFDVLLHHDDENHVLLYEIYDDERAFSAHCQTPHFLKFDHASRDLCESKIVQRYTRTRGADAETLT
jgi:(4S)-4-hydroxy-5-phosphonooxypentane-2,3-dione isomerase